MVGTIGSRSMFNRIDNFNHTVIDHTVATAVRVSGSSSSVGGGDFSTLAGGGFGGGGSNGTW